MDIPICATFPLSPIPAAKSKEGLMARTLTPSYSDDLSNVESVQFKSTEVDGKTVEVESGASLSASQRVSVTLTQGESVYLVDTSQASPIAALLRKAGVKQAKRGRKASS
jgi:hypothetical protein